MYQVRVWQNNVIKEIRVYTTKTKAIQGAKRSVQFLDRDNTGVHFEADVGDRVGHVGNVHSGDETLFAHIWKLQDGDRVDL